MLLTVALRFPGACCSAPRFDRLIIRQGHQSAGNSVVTGVRLTLPKLAGRLSDSSYPTAASEPRSAGLVLFVFDAGRVW